MVRLKERVSSAALLHKRNLFPFVWRRVFARTFKLKVSGGGGGDGVELPGGPHETGTLTRRPRSCAAPERRHQIAAAVPTWSSGRLPAAQEAAHSL